MGRVSENKNKQIRKVIEEGIEYTIFPDTVPCGDPACNTIDRCGTCFRLNAIGEAKIKTGRNLLHD